MITIDTEYAFKKYYRMGGLSSVRWRYGVKNQIRDELKILLNECTDIDKILNICKIRYKREIPSNLVIYITIDENNYILNYEFKLITIDDIDRLKFTPSVKYDIEDIRITTIEPIEKKLYNCINIDEQIEVINKYIEKPYRRFKKWETKPHKIFLYHSYNEEPIEFKIKYDKYIS
jgi:hypothetical protein